MVPVDGSDGIRHEGLRRLHAYWASKRPALRLPARADLDVFELREWLGHLTLLEVEEGGRDFRYRLYGTTLVDYFGHDPTGRWVSDLDAAVQAVVLGEYQAVVREGRPMLVEHRRHVRRRARSVVKLLLPLAGDGRTVDMIMGAVYMTDEGGL